jgi:hypothetical protein
MYIVDEKHLNGPDQPATRPFCIILHPKTASQSIRAALIKYFKARNIGGQHGVDEAECQRILNASGMVACVVRNPFDSFVSWWGYNQMKPYNGQHPVTETFASWLPRTLESGNGWIEKGLFYGADNCNRIIRFEHDIEAQLNQCLADCGLPPVELEHIAASPRHKDYRKHYTIREALLVDRYCRNEIVEWGYEF